jgi:hypothetical protein
VPDHHRRPVHWDGRKWPDHPHWQFTMQWLGADEHGAWLFVPAGTVAQRGNDPPQVLERGFVSLVPQEQWWEAEFYAEHPEHEVYVNIGTPCEWHAGRVRQVDLDLDVIRDFDGRVETIDQDEFAENQVRYAYPPDLIRGASQAAVVVADLLTGRAEPFGTASRRWLAAAGLGPARP